jgi:hypothetical protein
MLSHMVLDVCSLTTIQYAYWNMPQMYGPLKTVIGYPAFRDPHESMHDRKRSADEGERI